MTQPEPVTIYTSYSPLQLRLSTLFEAQSGSRSNQPLERQWYWRHVLDLERLTQGGLHPAVWVEELLRRLL